MLLVGLSAGGLPPLSAGFCSVNERTTLVPLLWVFPFPRRFLAFPPAPDGSIAAVT